MFFRERIECWSIRLYREDGRTQKPIPRVSTHEATKQACSPSNVETGRSLAHERAPTAPTVNQAVRPDFHFLMARGEPMARKWIGLVLSDVTDDTDSLSDSLCSTDEHRVRAQRRSVPTTSYRDLHPAVEYVSTSMVSTRSNSSPFEVSTYASARSTAVATIVESTSSIGRRP